MATKHNVVGKITIRTIEGFIKFDNDEYESIRYIWSPSKFDDEDIEEHLQILVQSAIEQTEVRIKGVKRQGHGINPIVINDIKRLKVK